MRKSLLIIAAVAILGLLALAADKVFRADSSSPTATQGASSSSPASKNFKDGTYTGSGADTPYGIVQISVVIKSGQIIDVNFLKMPDGEARSRQITANAKSPLKSNTLKAQSASIDFVTGATSTSFGYQESLQAALDQAARSSFIDPASQNA